MLRIQMLCSALIYHKLLMQKRNLCICGSGDTRFHYRRLVRVNLVRSFGFWDFIFAVYNISRLLIHTTTNEQSPVQFINAYTIEKFTNVRHYTETNAFQSVSAELRIALMCRILFNRDIFVNTNVIVCIKVSSFVHVAIKMCMCESGDRVHWFTSLLSQFYWFIWVLRLSFRPFSLVQSTHTQLAIHTQLSLRKSATTRWP